MALLPPVRRWQVTYNTYFVSLTAGTVCAWRFCIAESAAHREALREHRGAILDLTQPLPPAKSGELVDKAREGWGNPSSQPGGLLLQTKKQFIVLNSRNINQLNLKPRRK